jgi:hypothetical protein
VLIHQDHFVHIQPLFIAATDRADLFPFAIGYTIDRSRSCFHPPNIA